MKIRFVPLVKPHEVICRRWVPAGERVRVSKCVGCLFCVRVNLIAEMVVCSWRSGSDL